MVYPPNPPPLSPLGQLIEFARARSWTRQRGQFRGDIGGTLQSFAEVVLAAGGSIVRGINAFFRVEGKVCSDCEWRNRQTARSFLDEGKRDLGCHSIGHHSPLGSPQIKVSLGRPLRPTLSTGIFLPSVWEEECTRGDTPEGNTEFCPSFSFVTGFTTPRMDQPGVDETLDALRISPRVPSKKGGITTSTRRKLTLWGTS